MDSFKKIFRSKISTSNKKWQMIDKKLEIEMTESKSSDTDTSADHLAKFICAETILLKKHISKFDQENRSNNECATPKSLITSVENRFKTCEDVLSRLSKLLKSTEFSKKLKEHRNEISNALKELNENSSKLEYKLSYKLYNPLLNLEEATELLLKFLKENKSISTFLPKQEPKEAKLYDVLLAYIDEIDYLPNVAESTLQGMELGQRRANKENYTPNVSYPGSNIN